jgi:hypothetical protein
MIRITAIAAMAWLAAASAALADDHYPKSECYGLGTDHPAPLHAGQIVRESGMLNLPRSITSTNRFKAGMPVAVTVSENGYSCVEAETRDGRNIIGWIPSPDVRLMPVNTSRPAYGWWPGSWKSGESTIRFQMKDHVLLASGDSTWTSINGSPHEGEFQGHPFPQGGGFEIRDGDAPAQHDNELFPDGCVLEAVALGARLAVEDNSHCGGRNVRFFGIYSRLHRRAAKH